jgi:hypothetical protein
MRQKQLLSHLPRLGKQQAAMTVGGGDEAPGHVVAEERADINEDAVKKHPPGGII